MDPGWTGKPVGSLVGVAIGRHPDAVVVAAGHNDFNWSRSATAAAADHAIMRIHRSLPHALLVVVGPIWQSGRPPASLVALRDHLRRVAATVGALFIDPIAERWFAGSRHGLIGADGIHPTDRGHRFMASRILADLAHAGG
jgi:lysophospholipase L1-like esterase